MNRLVSAVSCALMLVALNASAGAAQRVERSSQLPRLTVATAPTGTNAFLIEGAGAAVGSAAGFLAIYALVKSGCDIEDLGCIIVGVGGAGLASTVGAGFGAYFAGRSADTNPSLPGAFLGAALGSLAGFGMFHVLTEEVNVVSGDVAVITIYVVTQSILTALGSRIGRAL